jgi:glycosyltransferase involved in cell wall biosynthesis
MPVYNGARYIGIAIESILTQSFADFELIISDNASTDETQEICLKMASMDDRIIYHRNRENIGAAGNYNRLVEVARAEFFRWSNADDAIAPSHHERCMSVLESTGDAVLCYGRTRFIDEKGVEGKDYEDNLDLQDERPSDRYIHFHESVGLTNVIYGLMRTAALRRTAVMGQGRFRAPDTNLMAELALYGKFIEIPETLFYRRLHPEAVSAVRDDKERQIQFWRASASQFSFPTWRKDAARWRAIGRAPIGWKEKVRCGRYVLRGMRWRRDDLARELLDFIPTSRR